jgi:hypothetical protein
MKIFLVLLLLSVSVFSCDKEQQEEENATVRNLAGLDGCGMLIELDNGKLLEPVSLPANIILEAGRRVSITYRLVDRASNCMAGETVEITRLRYL